MNKNKKIAIAAVSVIAVILVAVLVIINVAVSSFKTATPEKQMNLMLHVMPKSVTETVGDEEVKIYRRENPDYNKDTDELANRLQFYFTDKDGKEVTVNGDSLFEYNGEQQFSPFSTFTMKTIEKIAAINKTVTAVLIVIVVLAVIGFIVLWFFKWSKAQDMEKEKKYAHKNVNKGKKKKSKRK